ncbi:glucosamine inositolphosphorylceramide transferase family protein [Pseudomonas aeruginosa]
MKIKAALIVDDLSLSEWQKRAIEDSSEYLDIQLVLSCRNSATKKSVIKHCGYYFLNILSLKNDMTRRVQLDSRGSEVIHFDSDYEGAWQRIPEDVCARILDKGIKLVIKFGMSLLRIDGGLQRLDILSYHHGDPEYYRGRLAGFYEIYENADSVGIIVQKLSNKLDAGEVLVRGYSKVHHHSYKKTSRNFYLNSVVLLRKALVNYSRGEEVVLEKLGKNYRLPSNFTVFKFFCKTIFRGLARLSYGAFFEKKWNVVALPYNDIPSLQELSVSAGKIPKVEKGYTFYADPFFSADGKLIRLEALNASNGLGEIIELKAQSLDFSRVILKGNHFSYPYSFEASGVEYLIPEVASHSAPCLLPPPFALESKKLFQGMEGERILDGTLFEHGGRYYLFCGQAVSGSDNLYLYVGESLEGPYTSHPCNPVVMNPGSARMGGRIFKEGGKLYRFGQNNSYGYGSSLAVNEIEVLDPEHYSEKRVANLAFQDARGPHTIDIHGQTMILDFYQDRFSLLAGYRRLVARLLSKG